MSRASARAISPSDASDLKAAVRAYWDEHVADWKIASPIMRLMRLPLENTINRPIIISATTAM